MARSLPHVVDRSILALCVLTSFQELPDGVSAQIWSAPFLTGVSPVDNSLASTRKYI